MTNNNRRLARLRGECECSIGPAWLLAIACAALVLVQAVNAELGQTAPARAKDTTLQTTPPQHKTHEDRPVNRGSEPSFDPRRAFAGHAAGGQ